MDGDVIAYCLLSPQHMSFSLTSSTALYHFSHDNLSFWPWPTMEVALSAPQSLSRGAALPLSQLMEENRGTAHIPNPLESSTVHCCWVSEITVFYKVMLIFFPCKFCFIFRNLCQTEKQQTNSSRTCRASLQCFWTTEGLHQDPGGKCSLFLFEV